MLLGVCGCNIMCVGCGCMAWLSVYEHARVQIVCVCADVCVCDRVMCV